MSDVALNYYLASGTNAERLAFVPDPPTPAAGPAILYIWFETDTEDTFMFDSSWHGPLGGGAAFTAAAGLDPNGVVIGSPGDAYKSAISLGGDGSRWDKVSGVATDTGWE